MKWNLAALVSCILLAEPAFSIWLPGLMPPTGLVADVSACGKVTLRWDPVADSAGYVVMLQSDSKTFGPVMNTFLTLDSLAPGAYGFYVQAIGISNVTRDSAFAGPVGANLQTCVVCQPPTVTLSEVSPMTLWPPDGRMVPVQIRGSVATACPLTASELHIKDSNAADTVSSLTVAPEGGAFSATVMLQASRNGGDKDGRQYGIAASAQNAAGVSNSSLVTVTVPHDMGNH
jgi:hypothetical protein